MQVSNQLCYTDPTPSSYLAKNFVSVVSESERYSQALNILWLSIIIPCHPTYFGRALHSMNVHQLTPHVPNQNPCFDSRPTIIKFTALYLGSFKVVFPISARKDSTTEPHVIWGQRSVRIAAPCLLITEIHQPGTSSPPSWLKHSFRGCHLDVQVLLHQQLSSALVQHGGLLPVDRVVALPHMLYYNWPLLHASPLGKAFSRNVGKFLS